MMSRRRTWMVLVGAALAVIVAAGVAVMWWDDDPNSLRHAGQAAPAAAGAETLILYDQGQYAEQAELHAINSANLASHFGDWTAEPVGDYDAGDMADYDAVIYVGSVYDEPLPPEFLDDVLTGHTKVMWLRDNLWQLTEHAPDFSAQYGFTWDGFDDSDISEVRYRGTSLTRESANESGIADVAIDDPEMVQTVATAVREDGSTLPWAVRSGNLTYVSEVPFTYIGPDDRYLAFSDMLFDLLAPDTPQQHRALVRLEDVGPMADPAQLREIADYLYEEQVPFSIAVYPVYEDPQGAENDGEPLTVRLQERPEVVEALEYMTDRGGTIVLHGYSHQYGDQDNPYDGRSGNDFEFFQAHVDEDDHVQLDGPVPDDSQRWTEQRLDAAEQELVAVGLTAPTIFEFPHYAGSPVNYEVVAQRFEARYDPAIYFPGLLTGGEPTYEHFGGQFVPYPVRDVYGSVVVPENLGEVSLTGYNQHEPREVSDLLTSAARNLVVRDGMASFFYHPYLGVEHLAEMVTGIKELGYDFVPVQSVIEQ